MKSSNRNQNKKIIKKVFGTLLGICVVIVGVVSLIQKDKVELSKMIVDDTCKFQFLAKNKYDSKVQVNANVFLSSRGSYGKKGVIDRGNKQVSFILESEEEKLVRGQVQCGIGDKPLIMDVYINNVAKLN